MKYLVAKFETYAEYTNVSHIKCQKHLKSLVIQIC